MMTKIGKDTRIKSRDEQGTLAPSSRRGGAGLDLLRLLKNRSMRCFHCGKESHIARDYQTKLERRQKCSIKTNINPIWKRMRNELLTTVVRNVNRPECVIMRGCTKEVHPKGIHNNRPVVLVDSGLLEDVLNDVKHFMSMEETIPVQVELANSS